MLPRALAWIATAAGIVLIVVLVTGGFRFDVGPIRLSAHGLAQPLLVMVACGLALSRLGASATRHAFERITARVTKHALVITIAAAAGIAGVGVGFGTFSASSADSPAYVSHAVLIDSERLTIEEPLARAVDWHEATWTFTPLGYRPGREPGTLVPGYPLGLPFVRTATHRVTGEYGPFLVGPVLAALAVLATYAVAARWAAPRPVPSPPCS